MKRFIYLISPTGFEAVMYNVLSLFLLLVGSYKQIFNQIQSQPHEAVNTSIQLNPREFSSLFESQNWLAVASTAFFWSMVGLVLAFVGWAFINTLIDFYNTYIVSTNFMHPRHFAQSSWWGDYLLKLFVRGAAGFGLIIYIFILIRFIYPYCLRYFRELIDDLDNPILWLKTVALMLLLGVAVHVVVILFRLLAMKPRIMDNR